MRVRTARCGPMGQNVGRIAPLGGGPGLMDRRLRQVARSIGDTAVHVGDSRLHRAGARRLLFVIVRWGSLAVQPPPGPAEEETVRVDQPPVGLVVRRYLWYLTLVISAGVGAGILAAGAGGRLAMRLPAVTAGPDAQGRITEADQIVGRISLDGTLEFIDFTGLFFGAASGWPTCSCGAGSPRAGPLASPSAPCSWSWPAPGWSRCVWTTPTSTWWGRGGCRWPSSPPSCSSTACWSPPWPAG